MLDVVRTHALAQQIQAPCRLQFLDDEIEAFIVGQQAASLS